MRLRCWGGKSYNYLKPEERATVMLMMRDGAMVRSIARTLSRAPSTISRELEKSVPMGRNMRLLRPERVPVRGDTRGDADPSWVLTRCCLALWNIYSEIDGLLRQYLPKVTDLSGFTQDQLNPIAWQMNNRPRKIHGF